MSDSIKEMQLQVHLAEYSALRDEILALIKWRDSLVFISLSISGAIFSFVFSQDSTAKNLSHWTALYLIAPLASLVGGLWMVNTWRIARIGYYLNGVIAIKINSIFNSSVMENKYTPEVRVMEWESSNQRLKYKWERRASEWLIYLMTFVVPGMLSQALLLKKTEGSFLTQITHLEFPIVYLTNTIMVVIAFIGFMGYLLTGFRLKSRATIRK